MALVYQHRCGASVQLLFLSMLELFIVVFFWTPLTCVATFPVQPSTGSPRTANLTVAPLKEQAELHVFLTWGQGQALTFLTFEFVD